jgi:hypothetical protein
LVSRTSAFLRRFVRQRARTADVANAPLRNFRICHRASRLKFGGAVVIGADDALQPLITTSDLIVGQNRFAFRRAKHGKLIDHAEVLVRLFDLREPKRISQPEPMRLFGR